MKRGEIYTVNFDPSQGSEIKKIRPAVIVSNNACNRYSQTITVIPLSSQINKVLPFEVLIKRVESGLPLDSKVKANQIRSIDKSRMIKLVGALSDEIMELIDTAIKLHLAIK